MAELFDLRGKRVLVAGHRGMADLLKTYSGNEHVNVGSVDDVTILKLAQLVWDTVGFKGRIATDPSRPDGRPRKLMDAQDPVPHPRLGNGRQRHGPDRARNVAQGPEQLLSPPPRRVSG